MKALNFNNIKRQYLTITLPDEKQTAIMVGTPTKSLLNRLSSLSVDLNGGDALEELYALIADIMSRNKGGIKITKEHLEDCFTIEDLIVFIAEYKEFLGTLASAKN